MTEAAATPGPVTELTEAEADAVAMGDYKYGWSNDDSAGNYAFKSEKGLNEAVIRDISKRKDEPEWMLEERLKSYQYFLDRPMPEWGADLSGIDFDDIYYYIKPTETQAKSWE